MTREDFEHDILQVLEEVDPHPSNWAATAERIANLAEAYSGQADGFVLIRGKIDEYKVSFDNKKGLIVKVRVNNTPADRMLLACLGDGAVNMHGEQADIEAMDAANRLADNGVEVHEAPERALV